MQKKVFVAMSGGVDSSLAAALLKSQGYSVVGVFMKFWSPSASASDSSLDYCLWKEERADAARVAAVLGIPLLTWDFTQEYEKKVVDYMVEAYRMGVTPNPDIMCNKEIKFGLFFDRAIQAGADFIATGHYARVAPKNPKYKYQIPNKLQNPKANNIDIDTDLVHEQNDSQKYELLQAADKNKDQSYFLYPLEQRHLERTLFPIGDLTKPEVRKLAEDFNLPTATKKDSQGVCFIGPLKMREFLKDYIKPKKGKVIWAGRKQSADNGKPPTVNRQTQTVLGEHDGAFYYTIGQRHGIDLKLGGGPYYVIGKDINNNIIYVGDEADLCSKMAIVSNVHWVGEIPALPTNIGVKIRYRSESVSARLELGNPDPIKKNEQAKSNNLTPSAMRGEANLMIKFNSAVRAVTPGQAAVFYDGEKVLGGGVILG